MTDEKLPRKLAAILHADVAGFSRLTEQDEDGTLRDLRARLAHFTEWVARYRGRIVDQAGDSVLAIFGSAADALSCAAHIQLALATANEPLPPARRIEYRIGLNLGDVIEDHGRVFGDGVNVAARLQALAQPGGICVSGSVFDAVGQRLPFEFDYLGAQTVKNIERPVRGYHARLKTDAGAASLPQPGAATRAAVRWPVIATVAGIVVLVALLAVWRFGEPEPSFPPTARAALPTIAVLPFVNRSADPEQQYFADGVSEDIITDLSALSGLVVVSRSASFAYKGKETDPQLAGRELGADFLLGGSIRKAGPDLRITAELVSTKDGIQRWAQRYDRKVAGAFSFQDEVTRSIVKAMEVRLTPREEQNLGRVATASFEAYDLFLQGQKLYNERIRESSDAAMAAYRGAIARDPGFARAYGALAVAQTMANRMGWSVRPQEQADEALIVAKKAVELSPDSPQTWWALGFTHLFRKEFREAASAVERSIELAPNYADGYGLLAFINNHLGRGDDALRQINKAMALNPHYTYDYPWNQGFAYYNLERYPNAVDSLKLAIERNPNVEYPHIILAASYAALGQKDNAEWEIDQLRQLYPHLTLANVEVTTAIGDPGLLKRLIGHLRSAGLPE